MQKLLPQYVTIFMLHRASPSNGAYLGTCPKLLDNCLNYAKKNNYQFLSIDEVVKMAIEGKSTSRPSLCFTLDDGFSDQLFELIPVLLKYEAKPTFFVLADFISQLNWPWDAKISYIIANTKTNEDFFKFEGTQFSLDFTSQEKRIATRRKIVQYAKTIDPNGLNRLLAALENQFNIAIPEKAPQQYSSPTWEQLRKFENDGLHVGSHACSHRVFSSLSLEDVKEEMQRAKSILNREINNPSSVFCYPSGTARDYHNEHAKLVENLGYQAAVSANPGNPTFIDIKNDLFNIKRHSFPKSMDYFVRYTSWIEYLRGKI